MIGRSIARPLGAVFISLCTKGENLHPNDTKKSPKKVLGSEVDCSTIGEDKEDFILSISDNRFENG